MRRPLIRTPAEALALARIGLGAATVLNALEMLHLFSRIADGRLAMPVVTWFPEATTAAVWALTIAAVAAGLAITVGYRVEWAAAVSTVLSGFVFLWDEQSYSSHRWLGLLLVGCLVWARSDRVWAARPQPTRVPAPEWPRFLMMTQLSVVYLFAGLSKVNPVFPSGEAFDGWLRWDLLQTLDMSMAIGTILTEVFIAVALWFPGPRPVAMLLGASLHASIVVTMADQTLPLIAFGLTCVPLYGLFLVPLTPPLPSPVRRAGAPAGRPS